MIWVQCFLIEDLSDICIQYHWRRCQRSQTFFFLSFLSNICICMCQIFVRNVTDIGAGGGCPQQKSTAGRNFVKNFWPQLRKTTTSKNCNYEKLQLQKTATSGNLLLLRTLVTHNDNNNNHKKIATIFWCFWGIHAAKITNNKTWQYLNIWMIKMEGMV